MATVSGGSIEITAAIRDKASADLRKLRGQFREFGKDAEKSMSRVQRAGQKLESFGKSATRVGKQMTMRMTLPMAGAGAAAFKMASDFEASMTQIQSLVGLSADSVQGFEKDVLSLSGQTARAPKELADAMFFVTSAGIRGAEATEVLAASAKAAAVGLGDTATIADLATSALNAYGSDVISATEATDVMVAAVREGKLQADELAGSMGRVLPVAAGMGVSFNEVGAAFASMSRTGTNANEAATQLRQIMVSLLKPTKQAEEALQGMGLSSEGLRTQMREKGLLSTLQTLSTEFDGNADAAASVFGNVRALVGVMDLMGANAATTAQIFGSMADTTGTLEKSFGIAAETTQFKFNAALAEFKTSMIAIGKEIIPVVLPLIQKIAEFIASAARAFSNLSGPVKAAVVAFGAIVAIVPPLLALLGSMALAIKALGIAMSTAIPIFAALTAAVVAVSFVIGKFMSDNKEAKERQKMLNDELRAAEEPLSLVADRTAEVTAEYERLNGQFKEITPEIEKFNGSNVLLGELLDRKVAKAFKKVGLEAEKVERVVATGTDVFQDLAGQARLTGMTQERFAEQLRKVGGETGDLTKAIADKLDAGELDLKQAKDILHALDETADAYDDNTKALNKESKAFLTNSENAAKYARIVGVEVFESIITSAEETGKWAEGQQQLNDAIEAVNAETAINQYYSLADAAGFAALEVTRGVEEVKAAETFYNTSSIDIEFAVDLEGLMMQLNEAALMVADAGSFGGANDQLDLVKRSGEIQSMIQERAFKKQQEAARREHEQRQQEAARKFATFVKSNLSLGDAGMSESFARAIVGSPEQIEAAFGKLFDQAFDSGLTNMPQLRSALQKALTQQDGLISLAEQRIGLTNMLALAEDNLAGAIARQETAQSRVNKLMADRQSMAQKTASAFGFEFGENIGAKAQAARLLEQYTAFESNLRGLQDRGFPVDIISQVIGLGAFAGNDIAQQLLAMSDLDFADFLTSLSGISAIGQAIGNLQAGMMFDSQITGAQSILAGAQSDVFMAQNRVTMLGDQLDAVGPQMESLAKAMQIDFGNGIKDFISSLGPLPDELAHLFHIFVADLGALISGESKGITALGTAATGTVPGLLANFVAGNTPAFAGAPGSSADNPIFTDNTKSLQKAADKAQAFNQRTSHAQTINRAVTALAGGAGFAEADAASLGIVDQLRRRATNTNGAAFAAADASMLDTNPRPMRDYAGQIINVNVAGSVVQEKDLAETMRQAALEMQRSGKQWVL
jgi:TP901 family phage tail tape measure protein